MSEASTTGEAVLPSKSRVRLRSGTRAVAVVGISDDGCAGLSSRAFGAVARAQVLMGGERQLAFFPEFAGEKIVLGRNIKQTIAAAAEWAHEHDVCILASGDPLFFGVGAYVSEVFGAEHVEFLPQPTSIQWAAARVGMAWDDAEILSVHGRSMTGLVARLRRVAKAACLTDRERSPQLIAATMLRFGEGNWQAFVAEHLGGAEERVRSFSLAELAGATDIAPLNVLLLCRTDPNWRQPPVMPFLEEEAFAKRMPKVGLITKREVRLLSLAQLHLRPDSIVWDIGAGSGSVAIEAGLLAPCGEVYAVECEPESVGHCQDNALAHGADNVTVVAGRAPEALSGLKAPDAVFVGGSKGSMAPIVEDSWRALRAGGRLVVNAITMENVAEAYAAFRNLGVQPEVLLVQISRGVPLAGRYQRYEALNPIHIMSATKAAVSDAPSRISPREGHS